MNWTMLWPMGMVVLANIAYNIITKATPEKANPFLSLTATYLVSGIICLVIFFCQTTGSVSSELKNLNWSSWALGLSIIGLECGYIFIYRAGWKISCASVIANITLAICLLVIGAIFYHEHLTLKQLLGILVCAGGLYLISF